jgi:regulator of replication initiation timing
LERTQLWARIRELVDEKERLREENLRLRDRLGLSYH